MTLDLDAMEERAKAVGRTDWRINNRYPGVDEHQALARDVLALVEELRRLREEYIAHRLAAAILVGSFAAEHSDLLDWAEQQGSTRQPEPTASATRQIVADVRRYEDGTGGTLAADIRAALSREPAEEDA